MKTQTQIDPNELADLLRGAPELLHVTVAAVEAKRKELDEAVTDCLPHPARQSGALLGRTWLARFPDQPEAALLIALLFELAVRERQLRLAAEATEARVE